MKGEKYMDHDIQDPRNVTLYDKFFRMTIVVVTLPSWYFLSIWEHFVVLSLVKNAKIGHLPKIRFKKNRLGTNYFWIRKTEAFSKRYAKYTHDDLSNTIVQMFFVVQTPKKIPIFLHEW